MLYRVSIVLNRIFALMNLINYYAGNDYHCVRYEPDREEVTHLGIAVIWINVFLMEEITNEEGNQITVKSTGDCNSAITAYTVYNSDE